jgi:hypothetical protein
MRAAGAVAVANHKSSIRCTNIATRNMNVIVKRLPVCLFILAVCFFVGTVLDVGYYHFFGPGLWQPTIACDNPTLDFGTSADRQGQFAIRNTGSRTLILQGVKPSCGGCVRVVSFPEELLPGDEGVVRVELLTDKLHGDVDKSVAVLSNDPKTPALILRLRARIEGEIPGNASTGRATDDRLRKKKVETERR